MRRASYPAWAAGFVLCVSGCAVEAPVAVDDLDPAPQEDVALPVPADVLDSEAIAELLDTQLDVSLDAVSDAASPLDTPQIPVADLDDDHLEDVVPPEVEAPLDLPAEDVASLPDVTDGCAPWLPPGDGPFTLASTLGRLNADGGFEPFAPGGPIEIVQGPQGGVHLDVRLQLAPPATHQRCVTLEGSTVCQALISATLETHLGCCTEPTIGSLSVAKAVVTGAGQGTLISGQLPVVFHENDGALYAGTDCCVTVEFGARPVQSDGTFGLAPTLFGLAQITLSCVDAAP